MASVAQVPTGAVDFLNVDSVVCSTINRDIVAQHVKYFSKGRGAFYYNGTNLPSTEAMVIGDHKF